MIFAFVLVLIFLIVTMFLGTPAEIQSRTPSDVPKNSNINQIDSTLYITDAANAKDYEALKALGVKQILIVGLEIPRHGEQLFKVRHIKALDIPNENIKKHFNAAYNFIKQAPTVVHCAMGISRSATICASYLMRKYNITANQAINHIKNNRPVVNPNKGFMEQLYKLEKELKNKSTANESPDESSDESDDESSDE